MDNMLKARIIRPACSPRAFSVVVTRKKDSHPRFCIGYRALNNKMKGGKFPIPNFEEILDEMSRATVFINLDMFAGYWKIQLAEHVQEIAALHANTVHFNSSYSLLN